MNLYHVCTAQDAHPSLPRRTWLVIAGSEDQAMALLADHHEERTDDRIERVQKVRVVQNDHAAVIGWMGAPFPGVNSGTPAPQSGPRAGRWVSGGQPSLTSNVGITAHSA